MFITEAMTRILDTQWETVMNLKGNTTLKGIVI